MGPLLLFAVLLSQTLDAYGYNSSDTSKNNSDQSHMNTFKASDLQSVFADSSCNNCIKCMERAITAHKITNNVMQMKNAEVLNHLNDKLQRDKRKTVVIKTKRDTVVSAAKYYAHGKLYALKVKENIDSNNTDITQKCDVYKVEHFFPCNTTKANLILKGTKIHTKNKNKEKTNLNEQIVNKGL